MSFTKKRQQFNTIFNYTIFGVGFGMLFPILGTIVEIISKKQSFYDVQFGPNQYLIWIIDLAPIILGFFGYFLGVKTYSLQRSNFLLKEEINSKEIQIQEALKQVRETQIQIIETERAKTIQSIVTTYNHQINNPLAIAKGAIFLLRSTNKKEYIEKIDKSLDRISSIIKSIEEIQHQDIVLENYGTSNSDMIKLKKSA